ncbi:hypothetical protein [Serratia sp. UGAL515B_01]|uniref:hypothetical protein n=1 Tax=Serratia sp. UGAL515B_01 TaxID=2986763 RepID=UPI00295315CB|nr:hypothetical protein [Serratia sp. UGAL515B_01]WON77570.1 hypothetical protein OK023_02355 [Serratia sp. UGAL515B_01]
MSLIPPFAIGPGGGGGSSVPASTYRQSVFSWTGSQAVPIGTIKNLTELVTLSATHIDNAGVTIGPNNCLIFPAVSNPTGITIRVRLTGTIDGTAATTRGWLMQLRREDGLTFIDGERVTKSATDQLLGANTSIETATEGLDDFLTTQGGMVVLDNQSGALITLTSIEILIKRNL